MRYPHYMRPAGPGKWPSRIIAVDTDVSYLASEVSPLIQTASLSKWAAVMMSWDGQQYMQVGECVGQNDGSFWSALGQLAHLPGETWLISYRCTVVWAALDVYREIEDGSLRIWEDPQAAWIRIHEHVRQMRREDSDPFRDVGGHVVRRLLDEGTGWIVIEDPPCLLRGRYLDATGRLSWVDLRNYGADIPSSIDGSTERARYLAEWVQRVSRSLEKYKLGALATTASTQAMRAFKSSYYKGGIFCHVHQECLEKERAANYGGRCEAFGLGERCGALAHVDFVGQYTSICRDHSVPVRLCEVDGCGKLQDSPVLCPGYGVIAKVKLSTDEPAYPYRTEKEVIYPVGSFRTTLAGPELEDAVRHGRVMGWTWRAIYELEPALHEYAAAILSMRAKAEQDSDDATAGYAKAMGNSLVGKFGQRLRRWIPCEYHGYYDSYSEWYGSDEAGKTCRYRAIAGVVLRQVEDGWCEDASPAISAWITSVGRMKLLEAIRCAGWENVLYVDTDGLIITEAGYGSLGSRVGTFAVEPGKLRTVSTGDRLTVYGPKSYCFGGTVRAAGRPSGADRVPYLGGDHVSLYDSARALSSGQRPGSYRRVSTHSYKGKYRLGCVYPDGSVKPFRLQED